MRLKGWLICTTVLLTLTGYAVYAKPHGVSFQTLPEAKAKLDAAGFPCIADSSDGKLGTGFVVSREVTSWLEAGALCKAGPLGPEWKGKVWVGFNPHYYNLETIPDGAGVRIWGEIIAFGDADFLSQIDDALAGSLLHVL
jgi:hypothetical protein